MEYPDDVIRALWPTARSRSGTSVRRRSLVSRSENVVFRVDAEDGRTYALRVHRPGYHTLAELESEPVWTAALNEAGIGAPVVERTRAGGHYAVVGVPGTREVRHVGLVPWFEGVPLTEMIENAPDEASRDSHFEQLGRLMAAMHDQASGWEPPVLVSNATRSMRTGSWARPPGGAGSGRSPGRRGATRDPDRSARLDSRPAAPSTARIAAPTA